MFKNILFLFVLSQLTIACLSSGGGGGGGASTATQISGAGGSYQDLAQGPWLLGCTAENQENIKIIEKYAFSDNKLNYEIRLYDDTSNCEDSRKYSGEKVEFLAETKGTNQYNSVATNLDLTVIKHQKIAFTAGAAHEYNQVSECGISNWVPGQWVDITNTSCSFSTLFTIFRIVDGNKLYWGDIQSTANDGSQESLRPRTLMLWYFFRP